MPAPAERPRDVMVGEIRGGYRHDLDTVRPIGFLSGHILIARVAPFRR